MNGDDSNDIVQATQHLLSPDPLVREQAARSLGTQGVGAQAAVPALLAALSDAAPEVRAQAAWALSRIGTDDTAVPALIAGLNDESLHVRFASVFNVKQNCRRIASREK